MVAFTKIDNSHFSLTVSSWPAGSVVKIFNGSTDVTTSFTLPTITASGTYTIEAKDGKFTGTERLSLVAKFSWTADPVGETSSPALTDPIDTTAPTATKLTQGTTGATKKQIYFSTTESNLTFQVLNDTVDVTSNFTSSNVGLNYTLTAKDNLFNGAESLNLTIILTDGIGNDSAPSTALKTNIDSSAPTAPTLNSITVSKINQPIFNGVTEAGATVNVYQNTTLIGSAVADKTTGVFSVTPTSYISIGERNFKISATDGYGNISTLTNANATIGGVGYDLPYSIKSFAKNFTISYNQNVSLLTNHVDGSQINVVNFNKILFNDKAIDVTILQKASTIKATQFQDLASVYVGYFNRAPDAEGLAYWGSRLADGMSLREISKSFFYQPETDKKYSSNLSVPEFVKNTYYYVLGRQPDSKGLEYWVNQINNKSVERDSFVLAMISGAKATTGSTTDAQYLANKAAVSYNFAITSGLNNVIWASDVLSKVTDSLTSVSDANLKISAYSNLASSSDGSELIVKLVGIL